MNCNLMSIMRMIDMVLSKMERKNRASCPMPLLSLYAASKVYVDFLSRALNLEYQDKGIFIQSVLPAYVSTNMSKIRKSSFMVPSPTTFVQHALKTVGIENRTYGYWTHKLLGFVTDRIIINFLSQDFSSKLAYDSLKNVRRRYYKKEGIKMD
ncbi:hypothetical protein QR98_0079890 [Sarcoptes scabiei]|uniref:Uncharacterized protein n=1 Tax=Sarcoptes scabiei TaxID=52283 RepID=A0A132AET4_SARSC|nr:hypothetical protein QR98_0079890 [Sarcoptes scabiei]